MNRVLSVFMVLMMLFSMALISHSCSYDSLSFTCELVEEENPWGGYRLYAFVTATNNAHDIFLYENAWNPDVATLSSNGLNPIKLESIHNYNYDYYQYLGADIRLDLMYWKKGEQRQFEWWFDLLEPIQEGSYRLRFSLLGHNYSVPVEVDYSTFEVSSSRFSFSYELVDQKFDEGGRLYIYVTAKNTSCDSLYMISAEELEWGWFDLLPIDSTWISYSYSPVLFSPGFSVSIWKKGDSYRVGRYIDYSDPVPDGQYILRFGLHDMVYSIPIEVKDPLGD